MKINENQTLLSQLNENQQGEIVYINGIMPLKRRLLELGFVKGTIVKVINISPLKNSYLLQIRGYLLALRKSAVNNIVIKRV